MIFFVAKLVFVQKMKICAASSAEQSIKPCIILIINAIVPTIMIIIPITIIIVRFILMIKCRYTVVNGDAVVGYSNSTSQVK